MPPDAAVVKTALAGACRAEVSETTLGTVVRVAAEDAAAALLALKTSPLEFVMLIDLFGTDTGEAIEITYHLRSLMRDAEIYVRCELPYDGVLHSVWNVYASALMPERETAELLGLTLAGHPNAARLLTAEDTEPLLRKAIPIRTPAEARER